MKNKSAMAVVDVWRREVGELSNRKFAQRRAASEDLVLRLDIFEKLEKHRGCVYTASFNGDGNILASGADDKHIILWDWETGLPKLAFESGHARAKVYKVFRAKFMPYTGDCSLITCASDGQVRHAQISECSVETRLVAKHQGKAYNLAVEPGNPHLVYTCGEDALVQHIDLRTAEATELFKCQTIKGHRAHMSIIPLHAIVVDPRNPNLFAVGGLDDYTRLYDVRKYKCDGSTDFGQPTDYFYPPHVIDKYLSGETCLAFSDHSELLVSCRDKSICLFTRDMGLGHNPVPSSPSSACSEANGKAIPQVYKGHGNYQNVKGVSFFGPKSEYVVSGSGSRIFIWKKKGGELVHVIKADVLGVQCVESHPHTTALASSGVEGIKIWTPKAIDKAARPTNIEQDQKKVLNGLPRTFSRIVSYATFNYVVYNEGEDDEFVSPLGGMEPSSDDDNDNEWI
ncbi:Transducin/WD40 repeat-like superfamily protein isoform 2 [Hibiscus syriacus]|uniref:Transducin/WD40 repeat-like superfamily protein isoform 2 n=1 Tax=Hibiscus syriacus TaxID=106335 RepID=A0A6A3B9D9_HIBSY|nr:Transducin/WD40 repeat-like superfamily protein isoform 2 [Hibiscus syriacus]